MAWMRNWIVVSGCSTELGIISCNYLFIELILVKRNFKNMEKVYKVIAVDEMNDLPAYIEQGVIEFLSQLGHCLCLRSWLPNHESLTDEALSNLRVPDLELKASFTKYFVGCWQHFTILFDRPFIPSLQFYTNDHVYFKTKRCRDLDAQYGDMESEILKYEMSILLSASNALVKQCDALVQGVELAGYFDAYVSRMTLTV